MDDYNFKEINKTDVISDVKNDVTDAEGSVRCGGK